MQKKLHTEVSQLLEEAGQFAQQGKRQKAYRSSLRATIIAPEQPLAWYLRSQTAPSSEEQLMCLSRAYSLDPSFPDTKKELRTAVQALLKQEPFLAYVHETEEFYQVRSGLDLLINIPKNRVFERPYLQKAPGLPRPAYIWLYICLIALLFGGVGAFLLAPITAFQALRLRALSLPGSDRVRLSVILLLSVIIWFASIPLSLLLLIRFLP
jgi:hypothetical protein